MHVYQIAALLLCYLTCACHAGAAVLEAAQIIGAIASRLGLVESADDVKVIIFNSILARSFGMASNAGDGWIGSVVIQDAQAYFASNLVGAGVLAGAADAAGM